MMVLKKVDTIEEIQAAAAMDDEALEKWLIEKGTKSAGPAGENPATAVNKKEMQKLDETNRQVV